MPRQVLEYWLHPIAAKQIYPGTAAFDAARLLMVHNEYVKHRADFLMKAQLLLNKIQLMKPLEPPKPPKQEKVKEEVVDISIKKEEEE